MTSKLKIDTNRRNAKKSTGPKTDAGKAKLALNAISHGLSAKPIFDPETHKKIESLATEFADGDRENSKVMTLAREAAEAQIMVERVKNARRQVWHDATRERSITKTAESSALYDGDLLWQFLNASENPLKGEVPHSFKLPFESFIEHEAAILNLVSDQLSKLVRFERSAANQRDRAIRQLAQIEKIST
jgi:hypothetical protein